jgi:hypothetical protein
LTFIASKLHSYNNSLSPIAMEQFSMLAMDAGHLTARGAVIVATLCVGMHPVTLRVTIAHGSGHAPSAERGASLAAFPRRAWERSHRAQTSNQVGCQAASLWLLRLLWLLTFLPHREASFRFCAVGKPAWMPV